MVAVLVPVYFDSSVDEETVLRILEATFTDQDLFCFPQRALIVVDEGSVAEAVLSRASSESPWRDVPQHVLERNRGKAGAVQEGLARLLEMTDATYLVTRDCDGDHVIEDIVRLVRMAEDIQVEPEAERISVFGARPSLEKPMGWLRDQWERLTNQVATDLAEFLLARQGRVVDKRYWNGYPLDAQSGYRLYNRSAAQGVVQCLQSVPDNREILTFACEILPFLDVLLSGGVIGQVQRLTLVEQPASSYRDVSLPQIYGRLLAHIGKRYRVPEATVVQMFDNHLVGSSLYYTDHRGALLECRSYICGQAPPPRMARFL